jgi:hypothetical protein
MLNKPTIKCKRKMKIFEDIFIYIYKLGKICSRGKFAQDKTIILQPAVLLAVRYILTCRLNCIREFEFISPPPETYLRKDNTL